jgi:hypothetical protein
MSITRTVLSVNRCNCANVSLMQMYMNIKKMRTGSSEKDQSWYQSAKKHDRNIGTVLLVGSTLLGGIGGMKYMYDSAFNDDCSNYYKSVLKERIEEGFVVGSMVGATIGGCLALIYPYPAVLFTGVSMAFLGLVGPKYLNAKFQNSQGSKK